MNLVKYALASFCFLFFFAQGIYAAEPTIQTLGIFATQGNCNEIELTFIPGNGSRRIIICSANSNVSSFPSDNVGYLAGSLFGSGSNLGNGNYVVYTGSGNNVTVTGLTGGVDYYFASFEYNGTGNNANYLLANYPEANAIALGISMSISSTSGDMCKGDSVMLEAHGAATYSWTPSSSLSSSTDSVVWATPNNTVTYTVTGYDTAGCNDILNLTITVYNNPNVTLGTFSSRCSNSGTLNLTNGSPAGGVYSGPGVSGNQFNPSVAGAGLHVLTYTYTDIHGCSNDDTSSVRVFAKPNASFPTLPDVCIDATPFNFTTGTPVGGVYSGTGVTGGQLFNPSNAGVGHHNIKYIYTDNNGCVDTSQSDQQVRDLPVVTFDSLQSLCLSTPQVQLTEGTPAGGVYSGTGVSNSMFSPQVSGAGTFILTYTYSDSHNCTNSDSTSITVNTLPAVSFSPINAVCANTGPVNLTGGSPAGGTYSGNAVGGSVFYTGIAGPGTHTINYAYTDSNSCSNSASQTITVNAIPMPSLGSDIVACSDESVNLNPGNFTAYTWSTGSHTSNIDIDTTGRGIGTFTFSVTVSNSFNCINRDTILVTFDACSGISDIENEFVKVYPNPSTEEFILQTDSKVSIDVFDMTGRNLVSDQTSSVYVFGSDFPSGSYILRIRKGSNIVTKMLNKQ